MHLRPPASCDLEITLQGIKLILTVTEYSRDEEVRGAGGGTGEGRTPALPPAGAPTPRFFSSSLSAAAISSR